MRVLGLEPRGLLGAHLGHELGPEELGLHVGGEAERDDLAHHEAVLDRPGLGLEAQKLVFEGQRGRGVGDWLMRQAIFSVASDGRSNLALAVDSRNTPALNLYYRHGMKRVGSRKAMIKDLRAAHTVAVPISGTPTAASSISTAPRE